MAGILLAAILPACLSGCGSFSSRGMNSEGVRLFQQARYDEALRQFQEANYADPSNPDGYYNLAATYHRMGLIHKQQSHLDQAENYYNQCLDHHPNHANCYRGLAVLLAKQGRNEEAFRLIEGWAERESNLADPRIELARLYDEFGDPDAAKQHLTDALEADPNNARALAALGKVREEMGEHGEALRDYQRSLTYDQFQPQVASRVSALRSGMVSRRSTMAATSADAQLADRDAADTQSTTLR